MSISQASQTQPQLTRGDQDVLRRLAARVRELANRPVEQEKRELWHAHNALQKTRPLVFCSPENGWNEIILPGMLECQTDQGRLWETWLRQEIFWGAEMGDDRVTCDVFNIGYVHSETGYGAQETYTHSGHGGSYVWDAPVKDLDDISSLHPSLACVDHEATENMLDLARETFEGLLRVRLRHTWQWSVGLTLPLVHLRGLEQMMLDMLENPTGLHRIMAFLRDAHLARLEALESAGLLCLNNEGDYVGSGGFGWTDELPAEGFQGRVRLKDLWILAESQETVGVSPAMFEEFVFDYQLPILERFGLSCYGCCEPLDNRWYAIKRIPNLRRVSVSPWSDVAVMAENLQDRYIMSMKPNPVALATETFDEDFIRCDLRTRLEKAHGCVVEIIMKDTHTIGRDPARVKRWSAIAREEAERAAGV
ncbi:MAG: hypothetical protein IT209_11130 [Armatimonadetes bacterium]|nr:hypothetical protein [Armatimonadota bacterium]